MSMAEQLPAEGPALQSKKFLAFLVSSVLWKILAVVIIIWGQDINFVGSILLAIILVAGFVEAGYIIGQASLDKYVRLAHIAANAPETLAKSTKSAKADPEVKS